MDWFWQVQIGDHGITDYDVEPWEVVLPGVVEMVHGLVEVVHEVGGSLQGVAEEYNIQYIYIYILIIKYVLL